MIPTTGSRLRRGVMALLLALLLPGAAEAQRSRRTPVPPDPAQAARDLLAAADYPGALAEFERVMGEIGDENLRLDIARTLSLLGRPLEALEAFEKYLAFKGDALPEADLLAIEAEMDAEYAKVARIQVSADQEGVEVRLDGRPVGFTPLITPMRVEAGRHVVELYHPRFEDERIEIDAPAGVVTPVSVTMRVPPPPPPPVSAEELEARARAEQAQRQVVAQLAAWDAWNAGGWNPMPLAMPWTWADEVPAGFMVSAGIGVGDLTHAEPIDGRGTAGEELFTVDPGPSIPVFVGYRLHVAPMFAVGGYFLYQFHDTPTPPVARYSYGNGKTWSLQAGVKVRTYFPLGLLEPYVGIGAGYGHVNETVNFDVTFATNRYITNKLRGAMLPLEVGVDVVPLSYLTAGVAFTYALALWQELCIESTYPVGVSVCHAPGESTWLSGRADEWTFDFHVTFYVR